MADQNTPEVAGWNVLFGRGVLAPEFVGQDTVQALVMADEAGLLTVKCIDADSREMLEMNHVADRLNLGLLTFSWAGLVGIRGDTPCGS